MKLAVLFILNVLFFSQFQRQDIIQNQDPCVKKYRNNKYGVTFSYPVRWSDPYEFQPNNIGLDLRSDVNNWDKAGIVISFLNNKIEKEIFWDMLKTYDSIAQRKILEISKGKISINKLSEDTVTISNRKWLAQKFLMKGTMENETVNTKRHNYI